MRERGTEMLDAIQGPPRWAGPDLLLRQTSFRALAEPRMFREVDGAVTKGTLRVRFGEVEARGIAVTPRGRAMYEHLIAQTGQAADSTTPRTEIAAELWNRSIPATETALVLQDLAYFRFTTGTGQPGTAPTRSLPELLEQGWVCADPIVYEDFLPKSAAGIFQSNLTGDGHKDTTRSTTAIDATWLAGVLDRPLHDPYILYDGIRTSSLRTVATELGLPGPIETPAIEGATR